VRVDELIRDLGLLPHPEGGFYREIWRSPSTVEPADGRDARSALTSVYFLLPAGAISRWHRVRSDELWHHIEGAPLELLLVPPYELRLERARLGPFAPEQEPVRCVSAMWWQAARSLGDYALVSCAVAPGFDFADFELLSERSQAADALCREIPEASAFR
jgi:uncharacterized protein